MVRVVIPNNNLEERKYIINVLFKEFLNIDYTLEYSTTTDYKICLDNQSTLTVKDYFFSRFLVPKDYLSPSNIPSSVNYLTYGNHKKIPIIYGEDGIEFQGNHTILHADIFASAFFMLTRWEEYVVKTRDKYNRFSAPTSLAYKHNFLHSPIVNIYIELLWDLLISLGFKENRKKRNYNALITHDVDVPLKWWKFSDVLKSIGAAIVRRRNVKEAFHYVKMFIRRNDPYDTFDFLMDISEKNNLKSYFFFMSGGTSDKDNFYDIEHPEIRTLIDKIDSRGHRIGFHPSFNAYNDEKQFAKELNHLANVSPQPIKYGREHYLRFEVPTTWQIWENRDMRWDSTMSYHDAAGFRCGVCYPFPVFNIVTRKKLKLIERPLIVMEKSFLTYQNNALTDIEHQINVLINNVKKYNGEFILLWHNSALEDASLNSYKNLYERVVKNASVHQNSL